MQTFFEGNFYFDINLIFLNISGKAAISCLLWASCPYGYWKIKTDNLFNATAYFWQCLQLRVAYPKNWMTCSDMCTDRGNFLEGLKRTATNLSGQPESCLDSSFRSLKKKQ